MAEEDENMLEEGEIPIDEDEKQEEEDEETINKNLQIQKFKEDIKLGLTQISKVQNNFTYSYVKLNLASKELDKLYQPITNYKNLRYLDLSDNAISDFQLVTELPCLLSLNVTKNQITALEIFNPVSDEEILPNLQFLNVSQNKIQQLDTLKLAKLRKLICSENEISTCSTWEGHPTIEFLDLNTNKLKNLDGLTKMPKLITLILDSNELTHFRDLQNLPALESLSLAKNKFKKIKGPLPYLPSLNYFNIAENEITDFSEINKLKQIATISSLTITGNVLVDIDPSDQKREVLIIMRYMARVNDEDVTKEDIQAAEDTLVERLEEQAKVLKEQQEERLRLEKEEEERIKEEEQAKNEAGQGVEGAEDAEEVQEGQG